MRRFCGANTGPTTMDFLPIDSRSFQIAFALVTAGGGLIVALSRIWYKSWRKMKQAKDRKESRLTRRAARMKKQFEGAKSEREIAEIHHQAAKAERLANEGTLQSFERMAKLFQDHYGDKLDGATATTTCDHCDSGTRSAS